MLQIFSGELFDGEVTGYDGYYYTVLYKADNDGEDMSEQELDDLMEQDEYSKPIARKRKQRSSVEEEDESKRPEKYALGTCFKKVRQNMVEAKAPIAFFFFSSYLIFPCHNKNAGI